MGVRGWLVMGQVLACCCSHLMMQAWSKEWPYLDLTCSESHTSEFPRAGAGADAG